MYAEQQDELEREREEKQRKRQQDVLNSAKYYTDSDWTDIMGQVHANQGLTADLLGPDVNEDNFAKRWSCIVVLTDDSDDSEDSNDDDEDNVLVSWPAILLLGRKDLFKLYGMVVQYYEEHPLASSDQQQLVIRKLEVIFHISVHVLELFSSKILYMLADTPYPLSAQLMKKMLKNKLEVEIDGIGNDMTYAEQLIISSRNRFAV
ncbi:hypothetical protein Tco_0732033 [Tanacetum coccineum]